MKKFKVSVLKPFDNGYAYIYLENTDGKSQKEVEELVKNEFLKQFKQYKKEELIVTWYL